jgi:hypothetical protein
LLPKGLTLGRVAGPPITIRCDCGVTQLVRYGDAWTCAGCGRRWDTSQIPDDEYQGLLRRLRRYKLELVGLTLGVFAVFVPLIVFVDGSIVFLAAIAAFALVFVYLPFWRRRVRRAAADAPQWELKPED